ncbi:MAG: ParB N-terminal domain-containing protein [Candidatus Bathyarchaeota archaeon]|nr:ParB N-terminal domain-containing protein [Candidatus Bathyarchaeota archaeon]
MSLHLNPEYDKLLPRMTEEEFTALKVSIEQEGQHYPIIVNEDLEVLDGHHRFRACTALGIEPDFEVRKFDDKLLEKKFVIEANLRRRHLNNFQLVELAVPLLEIEKALAKKRQSAGGKNGRNIQLGLAPIDAEPAESEFAPVFKAKAAEVVAKKAGVSTRTFERGKKIIETASEDDKEKLREGKVSISKVYQEIVNAQKPPQPPALDPPAEPSPRDLQNQADLSAVLEKLKKGDLYCPSCSNQMLECSKCHKTLTKLLKPESPPPDSSKL